MTNILEPPIVPNDMVKLFWTVFWIGYGRKLRKDKAATLGGDPFQNIRMSAQAKVCTAHSTTNFFPAALRSSRLLCVTTSEPSRLPRAIGRPPFALLRQRLFSQVERTLNPPCPLPR